MTDTPLSDDVLLPCPFCGGMAFEWHDEWDCAVECEDCGNRTSMHQDETVVRGRWNTRALLSSIGASQP